MILDKTVLTVPKGNSIVYTVVDPVKSPRLVSQFGVPWLKRFG